MNHLIAKTKGKNGGFFKVISDEEIFELPDDLANAIEYSADYKLEEDEWFSIKKFSERVYCIELLIKKFVSAEYNQILVEDYDKIVYLCSYQTGTFYFQKLGSNQLIRKKYFQISEAPTLVEDEPIIIINNYPDAIYRKNEDTLYFRNLNSIAIIFKGIETLYREATQDETEAFLSNKFIKLENDYDADKVKKANRKRIAMAMDTLSKFTPKEKKSISIYIKEYCGNLKFDEKASQFTVESEEDLKQLLYGIEQRYYTTLLGGEKRLANSVTTL